MRNHLITLLLVVSSTTTTMSGQIVINELMQSNVDYLRDDQKEYPDSWVELYNKGSQPVSLANYQIGIKIDGSKKPVNAWRLPNITIPGNGYKLIYCDKGYDTLLEDLATKKRYNTDVNNRVVTDAEKESLRIHTDFRLESNKGCVVYLFKNGVLDEAASVMDSLPKQPAPNIAYGRVPNGSDTWGYEIEPSPGDKNKVDTCDEKHILGNPIFSVPGKVMANGSSFQLTLSLPEGCPSGTVIRYTDNGMEPTANSTEYIETNPIIIGESKVIRAKLFCTGWLSPRSTTHSYIFLGRKMTMPVISISTAPFMLYDSSLGIFANNNNDERQYQFNWRRPINIEYFEKEGKKSVINQLCETRVAGGNSRQFPVKSMNIYAHKRFGEKQFKNEFFPDQKPGLKKFKSLVLRNGGNDFEYLYLRDALAQRVMGMNTDIDWAAWKPVIVYVNGEYYGMLNLRERTEEDNIYANYDGLEDIDLFENWDNLKEGDDVELKKFKAFYNVSGHTMAEYENWMDCREFTNMMIMNMYNINLDFPGGNIVMWRPRTADGRWRWIAKDVDYSFGYGAKVSGHIPYDYNIVEWYYNQNYDKNHYNFYNWANSDTHTKLFRHLMEDVSFRNQFMELYAIYTGDFLNETAVRNELDPMYDKIKSELTYMRNNVSWIFANLDNEKSYVNNWIANRTDAFMQQLCNKYGFDINTLTPLSINKTATSNLDTLMFNGHKLTKNNFNNKYFCNHPIRLSAIPVEGKIVRGWRVVQTNGTSETQTDYNTGASLTIDMPSCTKLSIELILRLVGDYNNNKVIKY